MDNFTINIDASINKSLERFELISVAKSWSADQKLAFSRLSIPETIDASVIRIINSNPPKEGSIKIEYDSYKKELISVAIKSSPKITLSNVMMMSKKPAESYLAYSSRLMTKLNECDIRLDQTESDKIIREKLTDICPMHIRYLIVLQNHSLPETISLLDTASSETENNLQDTCNTI